MILRQSRKKDGRVSPATGALFLALFQILLWLATSILPSGTTPLKEPAKNGTKEEHAKTPPVESLDCLERLTHRIQRGDTLAELLKPFGLSRQEKQSWLRAIRKRYSPKRLRTGREIRFYFAENGQIGPGGKAERHLETLEIELNENWILSWERRDQGIAFRKRERPYETEVKTVAGTITDSLYESGVQLGLHPTVISQLVDIFAWAVNFDTDIREGDAFRVLYQRKYRNGSKRSQNFHILAAELINQGQRHFALYFEKENGTGGYYDLEGRSLARAFLRYPVEFSRIGSTFSHDRFHPILKVKRPHQGVDFVAKPGTPVRAVGNGRVTYAGWKKGGYGRLIEIRHGSAFKSGYAHLGGFARGIRRGARVKKGQIIGYVGCSGWCTGPHLHFELHKNHKYVNPLKIELPSEDTIGPALQEIFEEAKRHFLTELTDNQRS